MILVSYQVNCVRQSITSVMNPVPTDYKTVFLWACETRLQRAGNLLVRSLRLCIESVSNVGTRHSFAMRLRLTDDQLE